MFLNWNLWNHSITGAMSTHDIIDGMAYPLHDLGAQSFACKEAFIRPPWINVLFENFVEEWQVEVMRRARDLGCLFMLVVTEMPHKLGFNAGWHPLLKSRMENFAEIVKLIDVVVCLCPGAAKKIREWYGHQNVVDAELGWSPSFQKMIRQKLVLMKAERRQRTDYDPKMDTRWIDFGFYGPLTQHRMDMIAPLQKQNTVWGDGSVLEQEPRDLQLDQCKVGLNLKAHSSTQPVSNSRLLRMVQLGVATVSEPVNGASQWKDKSLAHFTRKHATFWAEARDVLLNWRDVAAEQKRRCEEYINPEASLGHVAALMRKTFTTSHVNGGVPQMDFVPLFDCQPKVGRLALAA